MVSSYQDHACISTDKGEWLFQHVSLVVHHGGAGTTACGLRYGKPTVIVPFFGEYVSHNRSLSSSNLS